MHIDPIEEPFHFFFRFSFKGKHCFLRFFQTTDFKIELHLQLLQRTILVKLFTHHFSVIVEFAFLMLTIIEKLMTDLTYSLPGRKETLRDNSIFVTASALKSSNFLILHFYLLVFVFLFKGKCSYGLSSEIILEDLFKVYFRLNRIITILLKSLCK